MSLAEDCSRHAVGGLKREQENRMREREREEKKREQENRTREREREEEKGNECKKSGSKERGEGGR